METTKYLSTYEVSRLCGVALTTVITWVNEGKLPAFRTPGGHRRILITDLVKFLQKYEMPIPPQLIFTTSASEKPTTLQPKILIVDDDHLLLKILTNALKTLKAQILTASDGFTAGALVEKEHPDIIILDIFLPGIDGIEVCRRIKSNPLTQDISIIGITVSDKPEVRKALITAGARECLIKPLNIKYLKQRISEILKTNNKPATNHKEPIYASS